MTAVTQPTLTGRALTFVEPLLGFPDEDAYTVGEVDPDGVLLTLRSVRTPELRFVVTPAEVFFPDYRPALPDVVPAALGADGDGDLEVLLILTIGTELSGATANLRAPVVASVRTGTAMQVVLDDESLPMRRPLLAG
jgi:flagellar assembly factor FliW